MQGARHWLKKAALSSGLPVDDLRIDLLSWTLLEIDAEKTRMLSGRSGSVELWTRVADKLSAIVPAKPYELRVKFIDDHDVCCLCSAKLPSRRIECQPSLYGERTITGSRAYRCTCR